MAATRQASATTASVASATSQQAPRSVIGQRARVQRLLAALAVRIVVSNKRKEKADVDRAIQ